MSKQYLLWFCLWCFLPLSVSAQFHYVLDGLSVINCQPGIQVYTIDSDLDIGFTTWELIPATGATILASDEYSITIEFTTPGNYTLYCTSDVFGENFSDILFILVNTPIQFPEIGGCFEYTPGDACYKVCELSTTTLYTDVDQVVITGAEEYSFSPGGINITWGKSGIGTVKLVGGACPIDLCFEIFPEPIADFETGPIAVMDTIIACKYQQVFFENTSINGIVYTWDFGDGEKIESHNAIHSYSDEGFYIATLTARSICTCIHEKSVVVKVLVNEAPQLDCTGSICPGSRQRYTATTAGCSTFDWEISGNGTVVDGGGTADDFIDIIWHSGPTGVIELQVSDCNVQSCASTSIFNIPVITPNGPIVGDTSVCAGEIVTYTTPYFPGTTYNWQVASYGQILGEKNMNNIVVKWNDVTQMRNTKVIVRYENCFLGCDGYDEQKVSITPILKLTGDVHACEKSTATVSAVAGFGSNPVAADVSWHIEDEMGQVIYTAPGLSSSLSYTFNHPPGLYTWVATNQSAAYCNEIIRLDIQVTPIPAAPLGITGSNIICPGQRYGFNVIPSGLFATQWTITDGPNLFSYSGQSVEHSFGAVPPYRIEAVHQDIQFPSCVSTSFGLDLQPATEGEMTGADQGCIYTVERYFTDVIPGANIQWEIIPETFGEIKTIRPQEVDIFWTQAGSATLRVTKCGFVLEKAITIFNTPVLYINYPTAICENTTALITTNLPAMDHRWVNSNAQNIGTANTLQVTSGTYGVAVTDEHWCIAKESFTISSLPGPEIFISTKSLLSHCSVIPPGTVIVANTPDGDYSYTWYLNGMPLAPVTPVLPITNFGTYHVEVVNQYGCMAISDEITFSDCCLTSTCGFNLPGGPLPDCEFLPYDFLINVTETDCRSKTYTPSLADFDAGSLRWHLWSATTGFFDNSTDDVYSYTFPAAGYYRLFVTGTLNGFIYGTNICGHYENFLVEIPAVADFAYNGICSGEAIPFEDLSTFLPDESIATWDWDFGDPGSGASNLSNQQDPSHNFSTSGTFTVTLMITMASGCSVSSVQTITVQQGPQLLPVFETEYCEDEAMAFNLAGDFYGIQWDFGDPASGMENIALSAYALHTYATSGNYPAMVQAEDIFGCPGQAATPVNINPNNMTGIISVDPDTRICAGDSALLTAPAGGVEWAWNTGQPDNAIHVMDAGLYDLLMYDAMHCSYSPPPVFISVSPKPIVIIQAREFRELDTYGPWMSSIELCAGEEFEIQAFSTGTVTYAWNINSNEQRIQFTNEGGNLPIPGDYMFSVQVFDAQSGCLSDSASIHVLIHELPVMPLIALEAGPGCSFNDNLLTITNPQSGVTYLWSDGQVGTSVVVDNAGSYYVTATNMYGCSSASNTIEISPSAPMDQLPAGCVTACYPLSLCLPPISDVAHFTLYRDGIPILTGNQWNQTISVFSDGVYTFEITTMNGCTSISDPLYVTLYTGVGSVTVETWLDQDGDGIISAADKLLPGIPVQILSDDGLHKGQTETNAPGYFVFADYPATSYLATIDRTLLSSIYTVIIDSIDVDMATCDDSVVVRLLLEVNCTNSGPDVHAQLCPGDTMMVGDSIWVENGIFEMHMIGESGCDSVFQVIITTPDSMDLNIQVWSDVDQNGVVSPLDTLMANIPVLISPLPSGTTATLWTGATGQINSRLIASAYHIQVDTFQLPSGFVQIYGEEILVDTLCGFVSVAFLLGNNCLPVIQIFQESFCPGDTLLFDGTWLTDEGQYSFVHTDPLTNCDTLVDVYVTHFPLPQIDGVVDWSCSEMGSIQINLAGTDPFNIHWEGIDGDSLLTHLPEGVYIVHVTDGHQCENSDTFSLVAYLPLTFTLADPYYLPAGDSVFVEVEGDVAELGLVFSWQPNGLFHCATCPSSWFQSPVDTTIQIEITDSEGCQYILNASVFLFSVLQHQVYVPNVFSPNNDGINDYWTISSQLANVRLEELLIFDRWGTMVYSALDKDLMNFQGWDGRFNGQTLNPAVFVYMVRLRSPDGQMVQFIGDITLIR